jgi:undecaprenyl-diphosphatase
MSGAAFFTAITWLGSLYLLLPATAMLSLLLLRLGKSREMMLLGGSLLLTVITAHAAKLIFRRPRPEALELLIPMPGDWSFPSAHSAQATAFFLAGAMIASRALPPVWSALCVVAGTLLIIGVAWSRVYLQVHYLSDCVAGCALAGLLVMAVNILLPYLYPLNGD